MASNKRAARQGMLTSPAELHIRPQRQRRTHALPERHERFFIPEAVWRTTLEVMASFGKEQRECFFWWGGYTTSHNEGQVVTAIYPNIHTDYGRVHISNGTLVEMHSNLRALDQILLVELHSHPPLGGGQNAVDAAYPAAPYKGFISMVIPNFGMTILNHPSEAHVYEYISSANWRELPVEESRDRFVIEATLISV